MEVLAKRSGRRKSNACQIFILLYEAVVLYVNSTCVEENLLIRLNNTKELIPRFKKNPFCAAENLYSRVKLLEVLAN